MRAVSALILIMVAAAASSQPVAAGDEASSGAGGVAVESPGDAQCHPASLEQLRDLGCRIEQAGCPGLREYQRETLDGIAARRAAGKSSEIADRLDPQMTAYLAKLLRDRGC